MLKLVLAVCLAASGGLVAQPVNPSSGGGGSSLPSTPNLIKGDGAGGGSASNLSQDATTGQIVAATVSINGAAPAPVTAATSYTIDLATGNVFRMATLIGNTTVLFSHGQHGQEFSIDWPQAAAGGPYTVTYTGITAPQVSLVASQVTTHRFKVNDLGNIVSQPGGGTDSAGGYIVLPISTAFPAANCASGASVIGTDSTSNTVKLCNNGGSAQDVLNGGSLFGLLSSITSATSAIVNSETQVVGVTIAANKIVAGTVIQFEAAALCTDTTSPGNSVWKLHIGTASITGGVVPVNVSFAPVINQTSKWTRFIGSLTFRSIGASGSVFGEGQTLADPAYSITAGAQSSITAAVTVDTTVNEVIEVTFVSGAASSSCTFQVAWLSTPNRIN